jgi:hypothetical protein
MSNFAVILNNKVCNVIIADSKQDAELATGLDCVEYNTDTLVWIGQTYDENGFEQEVIPEYTVTPE